MSILDKDGKTTPDASQVGIGPLPFGSGRFDNEYRQVTTTGVGGNNKAIRISIIRGGGGSGQ